MPVIYDSRVVITIKLLIFYDYSVVIYALRGFIRFVPGDSNFRYLDDL